MLSAYCVTAALLESWSLSFWMMTWSTPQSKPCSSTQACQYQAACTSTSPHSTGKKPFPCTFTQDLRGSLEPAPSPAHAGWSGQRATDASEACEEAGLTCSSLWRSCSSTEVMGVCMVEPSLVSMRGTRCATSGRVSVDAERTESLMASKACACSRATSCSLPCRCACKQQRVSPQRMQAASTNPRISLREGSPVPSRLRPHHRIL